MLLLTADGHYRTDQCMQPDVRYIVQTGEERSRFKPDEFAKRFHWKNVIGQTKFAAR